MEKESDSEKSDEEARKAKVQTSQTLPSVKEVQEHMITHLPFRSWCPHCVRGKAKGMPHRKQDNEKEHDLPTVSIDYMYFVKEVEGQERGTPTLVMIDDKSGMICARTVKRKGVEEYSVKCLAKFIDMLGIQKNSTKVRWRTSHQGVERRSETTHVCRNS